ncbi:MAG: hypothetical protein U0168_17685 [Nannocystaceae bacterium]
MAGLDHAARVAACRDEAAALDDDWNLEVAVSAAALDAAVDVPFAGESAARAVLAIEAWARRWRATATALCDAARVEVALDEPGYARPLESLDERRMELVAALETIGRGDARSVARCR